MNTLTSNMRVSFGSLGRYSIADAEISEVEISGSGGVVAPVLSLPLRLSVSPATLASEEGLEIVSMRGEFFTNTGLVHNSELAYIGFIIPKEYDGFKEQHHYLKFPLDSIRVAALEKTRAGGNLKFCLNVMLIVHKLRALNPRQPNQSLANVVWGYVQPSEIRLQVELTIPRDVWISRVLNGVGYGQVHIVELPAIPVAEYASLNHAWKALQQAQELNKIGLYDEAVGKCRVALDKFFEHEDKTDAGGKTRRVPVLTKSWETKLGAATYEWLNKSLITVKGAANKSHHSPNAHHDQFDSQMIIAITTTLVAYVARNIKSED